VDTCKEAISLKPDDADAHYSHSLGITYLILGDKSSALEEYKILKDLDKEKGNDLFNLIHK
jgi:tetratricopeptide (TPR) repeat protein